MGRPSPERRQAKRQRQKVRRKLVYRTQNSSEIDQVDFETELHENEGVDVAKTNTRESDIGPIGGADTDLVEMSLYDNFHEQDGEEFSSASSSIVMALWNVNWFGPCLVRSALSSAPSAEKSYKN